MVEVDLETPENSPAPITEAKEEKTTIGKLWVKGCEYSNVYFYLDTIFSCTPRMARFQGKLSAATTWRWSKLAGRLFSQSVSCLLMIYLWPNEFRLMPRMFVQALNERKTDRQTGREVGNRQRVCQTVAVSNYVCHDSVLLSHSGGVLPVVFQVFSPETNLLKLTLDFFCLQVFIQAKIGKSFEKRKKWPRRRHHQLTTFILTILYNVYLSI